MKFGITRDDLVKSIKSDMGMLIRNPKKLESVANNLFQNHDMSKSQIFELSNDDANYSKITTIELGIIGMYINEKLDNQQNWLNQFFNESEIKQIKVYKKEKESDNVSLTFRPALRLNNNVYIVGVSRKDIAKIYDKGIFEWDERVQREGRRKEYNGETFTIPKLNMSNVKEIKQQVLDGILVENELAYNLVLDSSSEGQELYYDESKFELTLANDFIGQIVDENHRTVGIHRAWLENPDITGYMPIRISNYTTKEATRYQYELSKATPIDKSRLQVLSSERLTDRIVDGLKTDGHLRGKISNVSNPSKKNGEIVSYLTLSDAFHDHFGKDKSVKVGSLTEKFKDYLLYLFEYYEDEHLDNNESYMFKNYGFYWHVNIFKNLIESDTPMSNLNKVIKPNYFDNSYIVQEFNTIKISDKQVKSKNIGLKLMDEMINKN